MKSKISKLIIEKLGSILEFVTGTIFTLNFLITLTPLGHSEGLAYRLCMYFEYTDIQIQL